MYVSTTEAGSAQNTVSVSATLASRLLSFNGAWYNGIIRLDWSTVKDQNALKTEIEKSGDGIVFQKIGEVYESGTLDLVHAYSLTDNSPSSINIYRLKLVETDGHFMYSSILKLNKERPGTYLQGIYPNPFTDQFTVQFNSDKNQPVQIQVMDMSGKTIYSKTAACVAGSNSMNVMTSSMGAGNYILCLVSEEGVFRQKLLKTR